MEKKKTPAYLALLALVVATVYVLYLVQAPQSMPGDPDRTPGDLRMDSASPTDNVDSVPAPPRRPVQVTPGSDEATLVRSDQRMPPAPDLQQSMQVARMTPEMLAAQIEESKAVRRSHDAFLDKLGLLQGEENKEARHQAHVFMMTFGVPDENRAAALASASQAFERSLAAKKRGEETTATNERLEFWSWMTVCYPDKCFPEQVPSDIGFVNAVRKQH